MVYYSTHFRVQVGQASNATLASNRQSRNQPVGLASKDAELLRRKRCCCPSHLGNAAAGELDADDVGVASQGVNDVGSDVEPSCHGRVVVHDHRDGARVSDLPEERDNGLVVEGEVEETRDEDQGEVGAGILRRDGGIDDVPCASSVAAHCDGDVCPAESAGDLASVTDELASFCHRERDGFAVGARNDDCRS